MDIEKAMKQAEASNKLEGISIKDSQKELVRARLMNEMTEEEFSQRVSEMVKRHNRS
ncbi:MAG: hypothetical protein ACQEUT_18355 [Bacillota bacterium]